jgi:hypothetical protein
LKPHTGGTWRECIGVLEQPFATHNVREVAKYAASLGLELALEMEHWRYAFLNSIPRLIDFLTEVDVDACKGNPWSQPLVDDESRAARDRKRGEIYENLPPGSWHGTARGVPRP